MKGFTEEHAAAVEAIIAQKWRQRFARPTSTELWNLVDGANVEMFKDIRALVEYASAAPAEPEHREAASESDGEGKHE